MQPLTLPLVPLSAHTLSSLLHGPVIPRLSKALLNPHPPGSPQPTLLLLALLLPSATRLMAL
jgi:hypothetical protein